MKRKELAKSSSRWEGHDFLVFEVKVPWLPGCFSGLLDPIIVIQASLTRSFCVPSTAYQSFSGSLKLMTSQVEQDACSFKGAYGRNGRQWVKKQNKTKQKQKQNVTKQNKKKKGKILLR